MPNTSKLCIQLCRQLYAGKTMQMEVRHNQRTNERTYYVNGHKVAYSTYSDVENYLPLLEQRTDCVSMHTTRAGVQIHHKSLRRDTFK